MDVPEELGGPPRRWDDVVVPPVEPRKPALSVVADEGLVSGDGESDEATQRTAPFDATSLGAAETTSLSREPPADASPGVDQSPASTRPPWLRLVK